jgi:hypothetical protein
MSATTVHDPVPQGPPPLNARLRPAVAGLTLLAGGCHLPAVGEHLQQPGSAWMGMLFILFFGATAAGCAAVLLHDTTAIYRAVMVMCSLAVLTYLATRIVAFPGLADDVHNWFEPWGVLSVLSETATAVAAWWALLTGRA